LQQDYTPINTTLYQFETYIVFLEQHAFSSIQLFQLHHIQSAGLTERQH